MMMHTKRPFAIYLLIALQLFLGIGGFAGGLLLILKPDGSLLGMQVGLLDDSPFNNYLIPGVLLFILNGLFPLFILTGLTLKPNWPLANLINIYADRHWAWTYSLYSGVILIGWITVQLTMINYFWLQPIMIFTGLLIIVFTMTPSVMRAFEQNRNTS